jgi:citrate lyase subunit beta / citryl-CoA lyase
MSKPYPGPWVFRTLLFTPGHLEEMIYKSLNSKADCVVIDLEDAVPDTSKGDARKIIRKVLETGAFKRKPVLVRINPMDTGLTLIDLDAVACRQLNGFVFPKPTSVDDIKAFDAQLNLMEKTLGLPSGHFDVVVLIETTLAALKAYEMATATRRAVGLLFGCEDYLADLQGMHNEGELSLLVPRSMVVMAARAAGIAAIDTPYVQVHNTEGFSQHLKQGRELGYDGLALMTPKQIEASLEVYTPDPEEVSKAQEIVRLTEVAVAEHRGIAIHNGKFISPPTLKQAKLLLERHYKIDSFLQHCG